MTFHNSIIDIVASTGPSFETPEDKKGFCLADQFNPLAYNCKELAYPGRVENDNRSGQKGTLRIHLRHGSNKILALGPKVENEAGSWCLATKGNETPSPPMRKKRAPKACFRFDWLDCSAGYESMRQKRRGDFEDSKSSQIRHCVMEGISTEFLCLRMVRIVPSSELKQSPLGCMQHSKMNNAGKISTSACACASYGWAIWYNAGIIFQLVAEQLGDCGAAMLQRADTMLRKSMSRMELEHLPSVGSSLSLPLRHNGGCLTQWHMAFLQLANNQACLRYEQARFDEASKMAQRIPNAVGSAPGGSYQSIDWADEDGDSWTSSARMTRADDALCRRLLMNAQVITRLQFANAA